MTSRNTHTARPAPTRPALLAVACIAIGLAAGCERAATPAPTAGKPAAPAPASPAPDAAPAAADDAEIDVAHSASLAGVAEDADAEPADLAADKTYVLPGAFASYTTVTQLRQRFGAANVRIEDIAGAEGTSARGVVLFPDDPERRAEVFFQDEARLSGLSAVQIEGERSRWRLDNGVRLGMPLAELVALNGKPISFSGFDWDYGGGIGDWHGGRLQRASDSPTFRMVGLTHPDSASDRDYPSGDATFRSDDKRWPRMGSVVRVGSIGVSFPAEDDQ